MNVRFVFYTMNRNSELSTGYVYSDPGYDILWFMLNKLLVELYVKKSLKTNDADKLFLPYDFMTIEPRFSK